MGDIGWSDARGSWGRGVRGRAIAVECAEHASHNGDRQGHLQGGYLRPLDCTGHDDLGDVYRGLDHGHLFVRLDLRMTVTVRAPDTRALLSPIGQLIATLGGNAAPTSSFGVCVAYDVAYNTSRIAGILQSQSDCRGYSGFGATLSPIGNGTIGYDETHQLLTFTSANQTVLTGPLDGQLNLGAVGTGDVWWMAWIGTCSTTNYIALVANASFSSYIGLGINPTGTVFSMTGNQGMSNWANSLVTSSSTRRCVIGQFTVNTSLSIEVRAQSPVVKTQNQVASSEPYALYLGGLSGSLAPAWMTGDTRTFLMGKGALSASQRSAINTYATTTDGVHNNASTNA